MLIFGQGLDAGQERGVVGCVAVAPLQVGGVWSCVVFGCDFPQFDGVGDGELTFDAGKVLLAGLHRFPDGLHECEKLLCHLFPQCSQAQRSQNVQVAMSMLA